MRLKLTILAVALVAVSSAQVWEKRIAPGLTYREEVTRSVPRIVHILRWNLGTSVIHAQADLCSGYVFDQTPNKGRDTVTHAVARTGAVAGINADFFQVPYTGDPLGLMLREGELISVPIVRRPVLAWSGDKPQIAFAEWKGELSTPSGKSIPLDAVNESAGGDGVTLNTETVGWAQGKAPDTAWVIKLEPGTWSPEGSRNGEIVEIVRDLAARKLRPNLAVVIATGQKAALLAGAMVGQRVKISNHTTGFDWSKVKFAVGGGPTLVHDGKLSVDWKAQLFKDSFSLNRHPRSAVGITTGGDMCLVAVDGRQPGISEGATLDELGQIMLHLGCIEAMNLDGGGSTCLNIHGLHLNRPSDGFERPVSNAILLFQETLPGDGDGSQVKQPSLTIHCPANVFSETDVPLTLGDGVPNSEILWSATGAGWIDQGGLLHATTDGNCEVTAWTASGVAKTTLTVLPPLLKPGQRKGRVPSSPRHPARR